MIYQADARSIPMIADKSVQCIVTSPPYFGLRDYGTATWEGGDAECDHKQPATGSTQNKGNNNREGTPYRDICGKCGAKRIDAQIGLEASLDDYLATMVAVAREWRRVLKDDGTVWLNMGDSYAANRGYQVPDSKWCDVGNSRGMKAADCGLKPKDLMGVPWRLAFALQADGWFLRADVIWHKPNPMPESVQGSHWRQCLDESDEPCPGCDKCDDGWILCLSAGRPTRSHEYIFLLSRQASYFYDADAVREDAISDHPSGNGYKREHRLSYRDGNGARGNDEQWTALGGKRNKRDVWTINSEPTPEAHFATFPQALVTPCILAGTSAKGECIQCGANWVREVERTFVGSYHDHKLDGVAYGLRQNGKGPKSTYEPPRFLGWRPTCQCNAGVRPNLVYDPFLGSGTVGLVAERLGRRWVGTELSAEYIAIAKKRTCQQGLFSGAGGE